MCLRDVLIGQNLCTYRQFGLFVFEFFKKQSNLLGVHFLYLSPLETHVEQHRVWFGEHECGKPMPRNKFACVVGSSWFGGSLTVKIP